MGVPRRLDEAEPGKQPPVAGQRQPHAEVKPRQAASPRLRFCFVHERRRHPLALAVRCYGKPAEVEATVLLRPQHDGGQAGPHDDRPAPAAR